MTRFVPQTIVSPSKAGYFIFLSQDQLKVQICIYHNNGKHKLASFPFPFYEVITKHIDLEPQGFGSSQI